MWEVQTYTNFLKRNIMDESFFELTQIRIDVQDIKLHLQLLNQNIEHQNRLLSLLIEKISK